MSKRRVVVTGLGMVSPVGLNVEQSWQNILAGKSGVKNVEEFNSEKITTQIHAPVKDFVGTDYYSAKELRKIDVFIQYAMAAATEALQDANLTEASQNPHRIGVAIGSGIGGLPMIELSRDILVNSGPRRLSPFFVPGVIINMASGHVSMRYGFKGPSIAIVTACTSGNHNIGYGARTIAYGDADVMVVGGAEMCNCAMGLAGFAAARALSKRNDDPERASRPWDKDRDGFVLGAGSGVLILEEYEHAKKRGATIYAELSGFGMSSDAHHITAPDPEANGFTASMQHALTDAQVLPEDIGYINAHGTSTQAADALEALAVKKAFGDHAYQLSVSSTKSMTGHLLGAAGAIEAVFSVLALRDQIAPPTINLDNPDEGCDLDFVPHKAKELKVNHVLSNSFGFGGTNASLVFSGI